MNSRVTHDDPWNTEVATWTASIAGLTSVMSSLVHCAYSSAAMRAFNPEQIAQLLRKCRTNNERMGLTGMLLHAEGSFFQVLEGESTAVEALYSKILLDERHTQVQRIISEPIPRRSFSDWTMGFLATTRAELSAIPGLNDFFGKGLCFDGIDSGRAKRLLLTFAEGGWRQRLANS
jgi:hypothetical protein